MIRLEHFYIAAAHQGRGLGSAVVAALLREPAHAGKPFIVGALRGSAANRFYARRVRAKCRKRMGHRVRSPRVNPGRKTMTLTALTGGCLCGAVHYEARRRSMPRRSWRGAACAAPAVRRSALLTSTPRTPTSQ